MKISAVIERLEDLRAQHGDLETFCFKVGHFNGDAEDSPITSKTIDVYKNAIGQKILHIGELEV